MLAFDGHNLFVIDLMAEFQRSSSPPRLATCSFWRRQIIRRILANVHFLPRLCHRRIVASCSFLPRYSSPVGHARADTLLESSPLRGYYSYGSVLEKQVEKLRPDSVSKPSQYSIPCAEYVGVSHNTAGAQ